MNYKIIPAIILGTEAILSFYRALNPAHPFDLPPAHALFGAIFVLQALAIYYRPNNKPLQFTVFLFSFLLGPGVGYGFGLGWIFAIALVVSFVLIAKKK